MTTEARPVLIVDDDVDIREALTDILEDGGFTVVTAVDGLDALKLLRKMAPLPSVILLDLMMPIMDGYQFLEERNRDAALKAIPVAIITAGHRVDRERLDNDAPIVRKPINVPRLVNVLHELRATAGTPS